MKKSKKLISMILAAVMATSCFGVLSLITASAADEETRIYFEVPTLESWGTTKSVYCHVYNVYGGSPLTETSWQSKKESCKLDSATGLYYFDTSTIGTIEEGADYALLFSTKDTNGGDHQTANITFGKDCLGDTVYVTGEMVENTEDSSKMDYEGAWRNNSDKYGSKAALTSTGKIVGKYFPVYQPKEEMVSQFLYSWAVVNASIITPEVVANVCTELNVEPINVYNTYAEMYAEELADPESGAPSLEVISNLLGVDPEPTTEPDTEPTTEAAPMYGDVDGDGAITVTDVTLIQKLGIGLDISASATNKVDVTTAADVNGDGRVSILDATLTQKYVVNAGYNTARVGQAIA